MPSVISPPDRARTDTAPDTPPDGREGEAKERAWREWVMVGIGLTGLFSVLAIVLAFAALDGRRPALTRSQALSLSAVPAAAIRAPTVTGTPVSVNLVMKSGAEDAKLAPDGKYHSAALPANFGIHVGDRVTVTVVNYDPSPHTFTMTAQNVNAIIPGGSASAPSRTTFTFSAPSRPGKYLWFCGVPCDPYSMAHIGFMRGYVTVAA